MKKKNKTHQKHSKKAKVSQNNFWSRCRTLRARLANFLKNIGRVKKILVSIIIVVLILIFMPDVFDSAPGTPSSELSVEVIEEKFVEITEEKFVREKDSEELSKREIALLKNELPEQLFDISFKIENPLIMNTKELVSRVTLVNFGTTPTPIDLTYTIVDESGQEFYREKYYFIIETESVLTKKLEDLELDFGKYTLVLNTLYDTDVKDEFRQDFEIIKKESKSPQPIGFWILTIMILIVIILFNKINMKKL